MSRGRGKPEYAGMKGGTRRRSDRGPGGNGPGRDTTRGNAKSTDVDVLPAELVLATAARLSGLGEDEYLAHLAALNTPGADEKSTRPPTRADLLRLVLTAQCLGLDPLGGDAYLAPAPDRPAAPPHVVLGLGGWLRLLNDHAQVCGIEFEEGPPSGDGQSLPAWVACTIHRRDRTVPTTVREYMDEARGATGAWLTHPRRMLRHTALVQCARVVIGHLPGTTTALPGEWQGGVTGTEKSGRHPPAGAGPRGGAVPCDAKALKVLLAERGSPTRAPYS